MVEASPLIEVYKDVRIQFEQMFCLSHKTSRHSPPKMKSTFQKLGTYMKKQEINLYIPGRDAEHNLIDTNEIGLTKLMKTIEDARASWIEEQAIEDQLEHEAENIRLGIENSESSNNRPDEIQDPGVEDDTQDTAEDDRLDNEGNLFVDDF